MQSLHKTVIFLLLINLLCLPGFAQIKGIGLPFIVNHPRHEYQAGSQNWSVTQSKPGFMYFGNNDGVLEYNGTSWRLYPVPNTSIVRSVKAVGDKIYAGAFEEIGYLAPGHSGRLVWNSLNHLIPTEFRNFDEVWNIFHDGGRIIFQSFAYIFILEEGNVEVIRPEESFGFLHQVNEDLYVFEEGKGLMQLMGNALSLLSDHPVFFRNEITCILPHDQHHLLIGTSNEGVFTWDGRDLTRWWGPVNQHLVNDNLYSGLRLSDGNFAFGSISDGVFITTAGGDILQHLNRSKGLQNNTVLAMFQDRHKNLWLGMDNGIDYVEISSPVTLFNHNHNIESTYATIVHNGIIYAGTNQGLFAARLEDLGNLTDHQPEFRLVEGTKGQVWSLEVVDNTLLCGHNFGAYQVNGFSARQISDIRGFWSFLKPEQPGNRLIAGTYTGLVTLEKREGNWYFLDRIAGFRESSRELYLEGNNELWVSHGYRGLFRLQLNDDFSRIQRVQLYHDEANLPAELPYNIQVVNGQMRVSTHNGFFYYDHDLQLFAPDTKMNELFQNKGFVDKIHQDGNGNLWYFTTTSLGLVRLLEDGTYRNITSPFSRINAFLLPAFQNLFRLDPQNVFIGSQNGLVHYDSDIINVQQQTEQVYFTEVSFYGKEVDDPYFTHSNEIKDNNKLIPEQPHALNSVRFKFTTPVFENPNVLRFSYRLTGFESEWSEWSEVNFKEYTNLREGDYVFEVKALTAFGAESEVSSFHFSIKPPFLRSVTAYVVYALLFLFVVAGNAYFIRKRLLRIRQREKIGHEKRLARREEIFKAQTALSKKEIMELRNEGLKTEMNHKNKELANATMHLIQKNKTLTELRDDLTRLMKSLPSDHHDKQNVNNLLRKVNRDLRNEKNWELFNNYFDEVHQDFLNRLKEKHTGLIPKEMRLCAYLRMNLSTKEIAPLMNISVRGVEISRYRLRKKLQLDKNTNLTEYMLSQ